VKRVHDKKLRRIVVKNYQIICNPSTSAQSFNTSIISPPGTFRGIPVEQFFAGCICELYIIDYRKLNFEIILTEYVYIKKITIFQYRLEKKNYLSRLW